MFIPFLYLRGIATDTQFVYSFTSCWIFGLFPSFCCCEQSSCAHLYAGANCWVIFKSMFHYVRNCQAVFQCTILHSHQNVYGPVTPHSDTCILSSFEPFYCVRGVRFCMCVLFCFPVFFSPLLQTVVPKASFQQITGREQLCYTATLTQKQVFYEWVSTRFPKKRALCDTWGSDPFPLLSLWRGSLLRAQSGMPLDHLGCTWAPACRDSGA